MAIRDALLMPYRDEPPQRTSDEFLRTSNTHEGARAKRAFGAVPPEFLGHEERRIEHLALSIGEARVPRGSPHGALV
eukprot:6206261-Pleurochrysis_carterae.AAC.1